MTIEQCASTTGAAQLNGRALPLTRSTLDEVQSEISQIEQLLAALDILVTGIDESCTGYRCQQLDALIGVSDATRRQAQKAQTAFETLFDGLKALEVERRVARA